LTDLKDSDSDDDGVKDGFEGREDNITGSITDPNDNDTDDDGLLDGCEIYGLDDCNNYFTNPLSNDTDEDGISDFDEIFPYFKHATTPYLYPKRLLFKALPHSYRSRPRP